MGLMNRAVLFPLSYLIGGIPFGLLIAKFFYHTNIRQHGSGNPGATNVWRVLGKKPGITTLILDILKGVGAVLLAKYFRPGDSPAAIGAGLLAIIGHNWSPFLKFKGGKGVATSAGVFLALLPLHMSMAIAGFLIFFLTTRHVSVGSMAGAIVLFISSYIIPVDKLFHSVILLASLMILLKHIPNMKRLAQGTEPKVNFK